MLNWTRSIAPVTNAMMHTDSDSQKRIRNTFIKTCDRWKLDTLQRKCLLGFLEHELDNETDELFVNDNFHNLPDDLDDRIGYLIKIGLGLQILFASNRCAEIRWLHGKRKNLKNLSPIEYMSQGNLSNIIQVAELVDRDRNL